MIIMAVCTHSATRRAYCRGCGGQGSGSSTLARRLFEVGAMPERVPRRCHIPWAHLEWLKLPIFEADAKPGSPGLDPTQNHRGRRPRRSSYLVHTGIPFPVCVCVCVQDVPLSAPAQHIHRVTETTELSDSCVQSSLRRNHLLCSWYHSMYGVNNVASGRLPDDNQT
jgi:hypothetical protein